MTAAEYKELCDQARKMDEVVCNDVPRLSLDMHRFEVDRYGHLRIYTGPHGYFSSKHVGQLIEWLQKVYP